MKDSGPSWKCGHCGFTLEAPAPPDKCPACGQQCEFVNVTCYLPDCGAEAGPGIDPRLGGDKDLK
jgi:rubredoxin